MFHTFINLTNIYYTPTRLCADSEGTVVNKKTSLKKLIEKKKKTRTHSIKFDRVKIIYFQFIIFFLRYVRLLKA